MQMKRSLCLTGLALALFAFIISCTVSNPPGNTLQAVSCPIAFKQSPSQVKAYATENFDLRLRTLLSCTGSGTLQWTVLGSLPSFLTFDAQAERLFGSPQVADVGTYSFSLTVQDGEDGAINPVVFRVTARPRWTEDPIDLGVQREGINFSFDLKTRVIHPSGSALSFTAQGLRPWMGLSSGGILSGTPRRQDVGSYSQITFTATAPDGELASAGAFGVVVKVIRPPHWVSALIFLPDAFEDAPIAINLIPFVENPENTTLRFEKTSGPNWVSISSVGLLSGTPRAADVGPVTVEAKFFTTVDNTNFEEPTTLRFEVFHVNHPPIWTQTSLPVATVGVSYEQNLVTFVEEKDASDRLTFGLVSGPDWLTLDAGGLLHGTPDPSHVGTGIVHVRVTDSAGASVEVNLNLQVKMPNRHPVIEMGRIDVTLRAGETLQVDLSDPQRVHDPDGDPLQFTLLNPPPWVLLTPSGQLTLMPSNDNIGNHSIGFRVSDGSLSTDGVIQITVQPPVRPSTDIHPVDEPSPGARVENLWVMDNSCRNEKSKSLLRSVVENIHRFFEPITQMSIDSVGVFLSSNVTRFDGVPITSSNGNILMVGSPPDVIRDFENRSLVGCNDKCIISSPIWSMFRFYERAPFMSEIYHKGYFEKRVPMEVLIVSMRSDQFKKFSRKTDQRAWGANDFAQHFIRFHISQEKPYRISVIGPGKCLTKPSDNQKPYVTLTTRTGGEFYPIKCIGVREALQDYVKKVKFRANLTAKHHIALSRTPSNPQSVELRISGNLVQGNTGRAEDLWFYQAPTNEVVIRWYLMNLSQIRSGDTIEIKFE